MNTFAGLFAEENRANPHPYLEWLRENHPVLRSPAGDYLFCTYAGVTKLYDADAFRSPDRPEAQSRSLELLSQSIVMQNPPEHTRLRKLFTRDFTVRRVEALREETTLLCDRMIDAVEEELRDGETVDLHAALSWRLPVQVMAAMVGVPEQDRVWLFSRVPEVLGALAPGASEEAMARADKASQQVESYYAELVEQRRAEPADDLTSAWVGVHDEDAGRLTFDELMSMLWGMVAGGLATTSSSLSSGILALLTHPLTGHSPKAYVEEVLRYDSPSFVSGGARVAVRDIEIEGVLVPAGSQVRTMLTSACRDAKVFPDPHRFDPARDNSRSPAFGGGMHLCMGANLARMQLTTLLPLLDRRLPGLEQAGEPTWQPPMPVRGVSRLPVRLKG